MNRETKCLIANFDEIPSGSMRSLVTLYIYGNVYGVYAKNELEAICETRRMKCYTEVE